MRVTAELEVMKMLLVDTSSWEMEWLNPLGGGPASRRRGRKANTAPIGGHPSLLVEPKEQDWPPII